MSSDSQLIENIRDWHRKRMAAMKIRKSADLSLGAALRTWLGWRRDLPEEDRKRIVARAEALVACGEIEAKRDAVKSKSFDRGLNGKKPLKLPDQHDLADSEDYRSFADFIRMSIQSRGSIDAYEKVATEHLEELAMKLPVWESFGKGVKGFGARSLGVIIGEAGDLSNYATHSKLWKRMALAPFEKDGITRAGSRWKVKGGLTKDDWIAFGYAPSRRARMFMIEDALIKAASGYYHVYVARKEYLANRALIQDKQVVPSAKIPKGRENEFASLGEINAQAHHYMGKRLLRDLWKAWRKAEVDVDHRDPNAQLPSADQITPEGVREDAGKMPSQANAILPPDQSANAPQGAEEARNEAPTGHAQRASSSNSNAPSGAASARVWVPLGGPSNLADATSSDAPSGAGSAPYKVPAEGQCASADPIVPPKGGGTAENKTSHQATTDLPSRKSRSAA